MSRRVVATKKEFTTASHHVQVAVRMRPLNEKEKKEGQTSIVKCDEKLGTVTVKGKQYGPFDTVFGAQSKQPEVYEKLLRTQIEQVLKGFNCTCFTYGQTGTGKTYSMEGDVQKTYTGNWQSDPHLGIIPRAIEHIFDSLDKEELEFCVRVSYIELYNEELYDLLAANVDDNARIRLFEDPAKKGSIIVSGAEEVPVRTRNEVFSLLQRGTERKIMAATLMNNRSSRSHCVFIVSVVVRETNLDGEELVRHGKLNLVDLAGSESIGRSGAEGIRAKEAGNINQSLLTLGRCIKALTTNAQHVPYRESKLTRLLQDSLGGSTITTLIGTISPGSANFEETVNTLDYASRAKNIKNHPEANEKLSRKALFKEYTSEIEKLRRDLRMAREKNGIFLSQESYEGMEEKMKEQARIIENLEEQIEATMEKVQVLMNDLALMDQEYRTVYARKLKLEGKLELRVVQLEDTKKMLAETKIREEATKHALDEMHEIAIRIRSQAKNTQTVATDEEKDLSGLWSKLETVNELVEKNFNATKEFAKKVKEMCENTSSESENLKIESTNNMENLRSQIDSLSSAMTLNIGDWSHNRSTAATRLSELFTSITMALNKFDENQKNASAEHKSDIEDQLKVLRDILTDSERRLEEFTTNSNSSLQRLNSNHMELITKIKELEKTQSQTIENETKTLKEMAELEMKKRQESINQVQEVLQQLLNRNAIELTRIDADFVERVGNYDRNATNRLNFIHHNAAFVEDKCDSIGKESANIGDMWKIEKAVADKLRASKNKSLDDLECSSNKLQAELHANGSEMMCAFEENITNAKKAVKSSITMQSEIENRIRSANQDHTERMKAFADNESSLVTAASARIIDLANEKRSDAEKHVEEEIKGVVSTGKTPTKRRYEIIDEFDFVPKPKKLLKEFGVENRARKSIYATRESMLLVQEEVMSPQSIKNKLGVGKLDEIHESEESNVTDRSSHVALRPVNR